MAGTDFFDEDLTGRETVKNPAAGLTAKERVVTELQRPVSDLNLTRMARHREDLERQVAESVQELDLLRMRQDEIERKRKELEEQRKKQDDYERGRSEITDRLNQSLIMMEKEEIKADRLLELLQTSRALFRETLEEIHSIDETSWAEEDIREELNKALTILDESRMQYNKTVAKIETVMADEHGSVAPGGGLLFKDASSAGGPERSFARWMLIGLAASLPVILFVTLLAIAFYLLRIRGLL
jgi:hypothetical protein